MDDDSSEHSAGFMDSARRLRDGLVGLAQDRLALATVEVQEEKFRLIQLFIWISSVVFVGTLTLTFASLTVVYLCWEKFPLGVLVGLTLFYLVALAVIGLGFRGLLARQPKLFKDAEERREADRAHERDES